MALVVTANPSTDSARPSKLFKARKVAELALQKINAYSVNDTAADPVEIERTLEWMELNIAQLAGTQSCWWLMKFDLSFALEADTASYDVHDAFESAVPSQRILFPVAAYLVSSDGTEAEIPIVRSHVWLEESQREQTGAPEKIFIDRANDSQTAYPWPIPTDDTYRIRLVLQTYARSVLETEGENAGNSAHGFSQEWQRWLVHVTAADIGSGPVRKLSKSDTDEMRAIAESARAQLQAFSNREKRSGAPRTEAWGA